MSLRQILESIEKEIGLFMLKMTMKNYGKMMQVLKVAEYSTAIPE